MDENKTENINSLKNDGDSVDTDVSNSLTAEQLEDMDVVDKQHYINQQGRAKKAEAKLKETKEAKEVLEAELKALTGDKVDKTTETPTEKKKEVSEPMSFDKLVEFQGLTKDLTGDEMSRLTLQAKELGVPTEKFITTDTWKSSLSSFRNETQDSKKTLNQTTRVPIYNDKTYKEVVGDPKSSKEDRHKAMRIKLNNTIAKNKGNN